MSELTCLELSVLLWLAHVLTQAFAARGEFGDAYLFTPRDTAAGGQRPCLRPGDARARQLCRELRPVHRHGSGADRDRTTRRTGRLGATIWIVARIVYLPIYLTGIIYVRTGLWAISVIGLLMMLYRLVF